MYILESIILYDFGRFELWTYGTLVYYIYRYRYIIKHGFSHELS